MTVLTDQRDEAKQDQIRLAGRKQHKSQSIKLANSALYLKHLVGAM